MTTARERYRNDPVFHRLVDMLRAILHGNQATPSELREALMLAVYCEEIENPSPVALRIELLGRQLAADLERPGSRAVCHWCISAREVGGTPCPVHPPMWCAKHRTAMHVEGSVVCTSGEEVHGGR